MYSYHYRLKGDDYKDDCYNCCNTFGRPKTMKEARFRNLSKQSYLTIEKTTTKKSIKLIEIEEIEPAMEGN
jgi:hypothetical protein